MEKMPKKLKSARTRAHSLPLKRIRTYVLSFFVDWLAWGYIAYTVMYLLNAYWYTRYVNFYGTLTLPTWGWPLVILATFELTVIGHTFGQTFGLSSFGFRLLGDDLQPPTLSDRLARFALWHVLPFTAPIRWILRSNTGLGRKRQSDARIILLDDIDADLPATKPKKWLCTHRGLMTLALIVMTFWVGWIVTEIDLGAFFGRMGKFSYIMKDLVTPSFEHFLTPEPGLMTLNRPPIEATILGGIIESVFMALLATVSGAVFAIPLSFLGARNIMGFSPLGWTVYAITRAFFNIFRSIESILWGIIFGIWVGFGPFAGVLALTIHTIAALGKLYSEQVESIDPGPLEALASVGARRWQVVLYSIVPQITPSYLAFSLYRWDINVRMSTIIAIVGGGGIGRFLFYYTNSVGLLPNNWNQVGAVVITIVAVVWSLDYISGRVRERIT